MRRPERKPLDPEFVARYTRVNLVADPIFFNRYALDGSPMMPEPWPAASRNVGNGTSDFLGVTVRFTYRWKAGFLAPLGSLRSSATQYIRLEPQSY